MTTIDRIPAADELNAMTARDYLRYAAWLRRRARGQGRSVIKSRRRSPQFHDYGTYELVDDGLNCLVAGDPHSGYGLSLDQIHEALLECEE